MASVLIVDDDRRVRAFLRRVLQAAGHDVLEARHGREALRLVEYFEPDLVLLAIVMPEMDGIETLRSMRRAKHAFPVVAMAAHGSADRPWCGEAVRMFGADEVLEKPLTEAKVMEVLARTLGPVS